jgi:DNA-binding transcriptional regulator LsrR (DeoR family)
MAALTSGLCSVLVTDENAALGVVQPKPDHIYP